ncbi:MAG: NifB/NifX family molybdenum-iron cluster-binding protein [Armatimonadota bacterium]
MKIAVTAQGRDPDSAVDPRLGRAQGFVLYDTDTGQFESADNTQNLQASQGAGIQTAQNLARLGAKAVITGHCGPKAFRLLQSAGIAVFTGTSGTVREAIEAYLSGRLKAATARDVEAHW